MGDGGGGRERRRGPTRSALQATPAHCRDSVCVSVRDPTLPCNPKYYPTLLHPTLPYPTLPYSTPPYPTIPHSTLPYPTLPYPYQPFLSLSFPALIRRTIKSYNFYTLICTPSN